MEHTYLRYECADAFALTTSSASSRAPQSNSILAFLGDSPKDPLITTAASQCLGFSLKQNRLCLKLGHREHLTGGVGTGRALNSDEVVCLTISGHKVATGWLDGAVRVFDVNGTDVANEVGLVHSLIHEEEEDDFVMREPLLLQGHASTPVRSICFDKGGTRLASGGSDGSVVLWDVVAETGLFRLLGHRGGITDIMFVQFDNFDGLITTCLDGLVKVWDLNGQCCTQTIANHRGEVWGAACARVGMNDDEGEERVRLVTGSTDGQVRVWRVQQPKRNAVAETDNEKEEAMLDMPTASDDDVCHYMGSLIPPPNVSTSTEKVQTIHYHPNGRYLGVLHSGSKNVEIYLIRSAQESLRKKQRRLRRRREKKGKVDEHQPEVGKKRGLLDDPESSEEEKEGLVNDDDTVLDPETLKASDEFEYYGTARASHKIRGFTFVPYKERGGGVRIVCALSTNALETVSLVKKKNK